MFNIGSQELLLILLLVFLFFGPRHMPGVARTLGKGLGDFQRTLRGVEDNFRKVTDETDRLARPMASIFDPNLQQDVPGPTPKAPPTAPPTTVEGEDDPPESSDMVVNPS